VEIQRRGFYPAGGGVFTASIKPLASLQPLKLLERGSAIALKAEVVGAHMPIQILEREKERLEERLGSEASIIQDGTSAGPGNVVQIFAECGFLTEVFSSFGAKGIPLEEVCDEAIRKYKAWNSSEAFAGEYLSDQLLLPMAIAGRGSFTSSHMSLHSETNMAIIKEFLNVDFTTTENSKNCLIQVNAK
jgi:RNA 3'-terminal phosphate cyclase (ATP)